MEFEVNDATLKFILSEKKKTPTLRDKHYISLSHVNLSFKFPILSAQLEVPPETWKLERRHLQGWGVGEIIEQW